MALLLPGLVHATAVTATLDRSSVQLGDTVTLSLQVSGSSSGVQMPDLQALQQDFDILGSSQNSSLSVVNGRTTSSLTFGVVLRPRHEGTLQIPALSLAGGMTQPLQLVVAPPDPAAAAAGRKDLFMEAELQPQQAWVGQQLSYVVRLFYASNVTSGAISTPPVAGVELNQIGNDLSYDSVRGGRTYHVIERRFALIPQRAGQLEIPAASFQGQAIDPNDPNSFFGAGSTVSATAPPLSLEVQAAPASWGGDAWLPARALSLTLDGWPAAQDKVRVGQPLNLTMDLQATGLSFDTLPALSMPALDGARVYPDQPVTSNRVDGRWLVGRRQQAFAIVPERAGTLTIPATTLKWWNVLTQQVEVAQIPAHSLTVLPATGGAPAAAVSAAAPASAALPASNTPPTPVTATPPWRWIALSSMGLWLLSALAWWLWRRRRPGADAPHAPAAPAATARQLQLAFFAAARGDDVPAQIRCLLAWARAERPSIQHLGELVQALDDARQRAAI
ncbi:MAG: protein BatD, partial [Xanthomonadaceae bacterium]|nr:protein BatD [Xanthomonadaceae bacterium]